MGNSEIKIIKRDGRKESLDINRIHFVVEQACEGLHGVSSSQIEVNAGIQFVNNMSSKEIQEILVRSASDLISLENPNYQFAAARLLLFGLRKEVFGKFDYCSLQELIEKNIERKVYDPEILKKYTPIEIKKLNSFIKHDRDLDFTYAGIQQFVDKYLVQDRTTKQIFETPQFAFIMIAATLFADYPAETRLKYIKDYYDALSGLKINLATPVLAGVRTPTRQFASCVLVDVGDSLDSIFNSVNAVGKYTARRAGIGLNMGRVRGVNSSIRGGEVQHTGIIPFLKVFEATVKSTSQNGLRGGCLKKSSLISVVYEVEIDGVVYKPNDTLTIDGVVYQARDFIK